MTKDIDPSGVPATDWRHKCAASSFHDHDGCSCSDSELRQRFAPLMPDKANVRDNKWVQNLAARIAVDVCEIERDSPEDDPMACIVYAPEITDIVERRVTEALSTSPAIPEQEAGE